MIKQQYYRYLYSFFMSLMMSCFMSFVITLFNIGLVDNFLSIWRHSWAFAFMVAYPSVLMFTPVVKRITDAFVEEGSPPSPSKK